jgi:tRNA (cytidine/uridine-2'-O-)-methyltransferase
VPRSLGDLGGLGVTFTRLAEEAGRKTRAHCLSATHNAKKAMRLALHQPDQAGNVGAVLRLGACLGVPVDIIEPCGFPFSDRALKRSGMDYAEVAQVTRHTDWAAFEATLPGRLVLFTTAGALPLPEARFEPADTLLFGSESRGAPGAVHDRAELRIRIPQAAGTRSLNLAVAAGIGLAEALRQTGLWPG